MRHHLISLLLPSLALGLLVPALALAEPKDKDKPLPPPVAPAPKKPPHEDPPQPARKLTCELKTKEAPRGGRLEVTGDNFGTTPLVRIAGKVTRIIERRGNMIAVQIHRDSNGGEVTVQSGKDEASCGTLTIVGKN